MKPGHTGVYRLYKAFGFSLQGLRAAVKHESAFRQECGLLIATIVLVSVLAISPLEKLIMIASILFLMVVELINSAIEATVDRVGSEQHELSGQAKDMGSAAVLLTTFIIALIWGYIALGYYQS
ncbi:diacylglycerol kinase [Vibrio splendidus]